jgi:hypothetical protein
VVEPQRSIVRFDEASLGRDEPKTNRTRGKAREKTNRHPHGEVLLDNADAVIDALRTLDAFTLRILSNSEVIDIDQDALGWQARVLRHSADEFILEKPLEDGSVALGLFNLSESSRKITASVTEMGLNGSWKARDLWRQKEIGAVIGEFSADVPRHGVILLRLSSLRKVL